MANIGDFGAKIGGARKDIWGGRGLQVGDLSEMNEAEREKYVKKDNIWKKPDYQKLVDEGLPVRTAYFIKVVRDALPVTVQRGSTQETYVEFVGAVRDAAMALHDATEDNFLNFYNRMFDTHVIHKPRSYYVTIEDGYDGIITNKVLGIKSYTRIRTLDHEIQRKQFCYSEDAKILSGYEFFCFDDSVEVVDEHGSTALKIRNGLGYYYGYPKGDYADISQWKKGTWFILRAGRIFGINYASKEDAMRTIVETTKAVIAGNAELADNSSTNRKKKFAPPQLAHVRFNGIDVRNNKDVTGENYLETFGFKGGEFGNWMNDNDRQTSLNMGYESLYAMAKVLNISLRDISIHGRLSIAFGARGRTSAAAHYEFEREVINLTKMNGAGSLAHEWGHALDDILNKIENGHGITKDGVRKGLLASQNELHHDMRKVASIRTEETVRAAAIADAQRYEEGVRAFIKTYMPSEERLTDEQKSKMNELIQAVLDDTTLSFFSYRGRDGFPQSVEALSEFRKEVRGHVIPKQGRNDIAMRVEWLTTKKRNVENAKDIPVEVDSNYYKESKEFDSKFSKTDHGYWQSECEMFARAFACFVHDKLEEAGICADYLVGHSESGPVPHGEERKRLNKDFENLILEFKALDLLHDFEDFTPENLMPKEKVVEVACNAVIDKPIRFCINEKSGQVSLF